MNINIIFEDNHFIAVNKRSSDIVQGDKTGDTPLSEKIKYYLKLKHNKPGNVFLGVIHRLDRPTSGVVLFAKTSKALSRINKLFKERKVKKTYWAIVKEKPKEKNETLINFLKKNEKRNKSYINKNGLKSELYYNVIKKLNNYYLLEIKPKTGRHHQIRAQLSAIGCPIKGDVKYGFKRSNKNLSIRLHAKKLAFIHPVKKTSVLIEANPPKEDKLWQSCL